MAKGDHIYFYVFGYYHHGIDCGDGTVIHYNGNINNKDNAKIVRTSYSEFSNGKTVSTKKYNSCYSPDLVVEKAKSRLGEQKYHLLNNNCEHFASWCKTGERYSHQVNNGVSAAGSGSSTALAGSAAVGVTAIGTAAGVSGGAGIMSGLAAVGGSAVGGIVATGVAPGAIATTTMHKILEDDEGLSQKEREARAAGRMASTAGAVAGTAGAVGAVSAAGTVAGLSGAGITSGLAAIGGTGGMLAGVAITAAAPAAAAAGIGFGVYKAWQWLNE